MASKKKGSAGPGRAASATATRKRQHATKRPKRARRKHPARRVAGRKKLPLVKPIESQRVVIKFHNKIALPYTDDWHDKRETGPWERLEARFGRLTLRRMFTSVTPEEIKKVAAIARAANPRYRSPNFATYFFVYLQPKVSARDVARAFSGWPKIEYAYVDFPSTNAESPTPNPVCLLSPGHLAVAPTGVSAASATPFHGGRGEQQRFIDIEEGWTTDHVSVAAYFQPPMLIHPLPLTGLIDDFSRNHGTAVLGLACGRGPTPGCTGVAPGAKSVQVASTYRGGLGLPQQVLAAASAAGAPPNLYDAIIKAKHSLLALTSTPLKRCGRNAILLIEQQLPLVRTIGGITGTYELPVEVLPGVHDLIKDVVALGIAVIEPAGNGRQPPPQQNGPQQQQNVGIDLYHAGIKRTAERDSGAILVGGAQSKVINFRLDPTKSGHNRHVSSNFGKAIDCYAWGENVVAPTSSQPPPPFSTGDCTNGFSGTSAASAIIAGVALSLQGICEHSSLAHPLHPSRLRRLLSNFTLGTPIYNISGTTPNHAPAAIGVMPDLKRILRIDSARFASALGATLP